VSFAQRIGESATYKAVAATWTQGAVALVIRAEPAAGLSAPQGIWLDLDRGVCREAKLVDESTAQTAPYCITGDYVRWKQVLRRQLDPIQAMMQKKLELRGQMSVLVRYVGASKELVECASRVPTTFLDEP
jgi:putative sterol carrier protein